VVVSTVRTFGFSLEVPVMKLNFFRILLDRLLGLKYNKYSIVMEDAS